MFCLRVSSSMLEDKVQLLRIVFTLRPRKGNWKADKQPTSALVEEAPEEDRQVEEQSLEGQNERHPLVVADLVLLPEQE